MENNKKVVHPVYARIRKSRRNFSLTLNHVATEINCSVQNISILETRQEANTLVKYLQLLRSKGVDLNTIFEEHNQ